MEFKVGDKLWLCNYKKDSIIIKELNEHVNYYGKSYKSIIVTEIDSNIDYLLVLISDNYGAGWSSWNDKKWTHQLLTDSRLIYDVYHNQIQLKPDDEDTNKSKHRHKFNDDVNDDYYLDLLGIVHDDKNSFCSLGFQSCIIYLVERGSKFKIKECDGCENIEYYDDCKWIEA